MRIWLMLTLSLIAFGCSKKGKPCPYNGNCGSELACEPVTKTCQHICAKSSDCERGFRCDNSESVCFSPKAVEQKREIEKTKREAERTAKKCGEKCKKDGRCTIIKSSYNGVPVEFCGPTEHIHCIESDVCRREGRCTLGKNKFGDNRCVK